MASTNPIGVIQVARGNIKIIGVDGVVRVPAYGDFIYEGEKIVSDDPAALFQVKYTALQEASAYDGPFSILADGSAISAADATENALTEAEQLAILESDDATAAGEEGPTGNSAFFPSDVSAESSVQGFSRGGDTEQGTTRSFSNEPYEGDFNDQPEIEDLVIGGVLESRGDQNDKDDVNTEMGGDLTAQDEDPFDNHIFYVQSMTLPIVPEPEEPQFEVRSFAHEPIPTETLDTVDYFHNGVAGGSSTIKVLVESDDIDPNKIDVKELVLTDNDGKDSTTGFTLTGDFNALADGEEATVTFQYFADDLQGFGDNDQPHETSISEMRTVEITVIGTNDRPVVHDIVLGEGETFDWQYWRDSYPKDGNPTNDEGDNTLGGLIHGWLHAHDDDVNNDHTFGVRDMTLPVEGNDPELVEVNTNGWAESGPVNVLFESSAIDASDITLDTLSLHDYVNNSLAFFSLDGDFGALGAGETATITFKYYADDQRGFGDAGDENNEASTSEAKTVTITICGTNDQPFVQDISETFAETTSTGNPLTDLDQTDILTSFAGVLPIVQDDDKNDEHTYYKVEDSESVTGDLSSVPELSVEITDAETGAYTMSGNFNALDVGESATVSFDYYTLDNSGTNQSPDWPHESSKSAVKTVSLTVTGTNDIPTISVNAEDGLVLESGLAMGSDPDATDREASGTFTIGDEDGLDDISSVTINGQPLVAGGDFSGVVGQTFTTTYGQVTIDGYAGGVFSYTYVLINPVLNEYPIEENSGEDSFTVVVSDETASATATVLIEITDDVPSITQMQDAILVNQDGGNTLTGADLGIVMGADRPLSSIVLTPEIDDDGFAVASDGVTLLTSTVGETTYNLVYVQNTVDGSVTAYQAEPGTTDSNGTPVFTLTPDITTGTYSVSIVGQLDGASQAYEINFAAADHNDSGNGDILVYPSSDDMLYVVATADGDPQDKVNYNSQIGIGASNQFVDKTGEYMTLQFTNSDVVTTSVADAKADAEGDPAYFSGATFEIGKFDSGDTIIWQAYHGATLVGEGSATTSSVDVEANLVTPYDTFNSVVFEGVDGSAYAVLSMEGWSGQEGDPGTTYTINVDIAATDADGDVAEVIYADGDDTLQVTFDNDGNIIGTGSDEMIVGGTGADIIDAGAGDDTIVYGIGDTIDGGLGTDTLVINDSAINLSNLSSIETIQLSGTASVQGTGGLINSITVSDVMQVAETDILTIQGDSTETLNVDGSTFTEPVVTDVDIDGQLYDQYSDGSVTLLIDVDIPVDVV